MGQILSILWEILSILWEILSILWEICYVIGIFRNHSSLPPPRRQQFWKVSPEIFFDNAGTIRKSRANFFPPAKSSITVNNKIFSASAIIH
jgi:hypothetical protein